MSKLLQKESLQPLKNKAFSRFILFRGLYIMSLRMVATVVAYQLYQITGSSLAIGLVGLSEFIPVFGLALYAGHIVDKSDKRTLLLKSTWLYALCVLGLIVLTMPFSSRHIATQNLPYFYYAIIFVTGVLRAFAGPSSTAIVAQLVTKSELQFGANISSSIWLIASIVGHASAGFFIAWFGVHFTFVIIFCYVLIASFFMFKIPKQPITNTQNDLPAWKSVQQGISFVLNNKIMLGAITLDLFAVLFGGVVALLPEYANVILNVGPIGFGWLNAAMDMGSMSIIVFLTIFPMRRKQGMRMMLAVAGFGLCILLFGMSRWYWLSFFALMGAGVCDGLSVIVRGNILQLTTPDEMRGRVSSVNSMFINSSNELGMMESGLASRAFGLIPTILLGGTVTLLVVIVTWIKAPSLKKMEY